MSFQAWTSFCEIITSPGLHCSVALFLCAVLMYLQGQADVSQYCLCQSNPGRNKKERSLVLLVGVASCDTNTPLALYSNNKLQDKEHSAGLCGLSSNEDSSLKSVWLSLGCKWEQQLICRYSHATKVVVFISLQSHTCKEIRSVRLVPALVRTQSGLGVHLISHRTAQSLSCEPLPRDLQPVSVRATHVSKDLQIWPWWDVPCL